MAAKQRLRDKKGRGRGGNSKTDDDDDEEEAADPLSALFEEAVDLFLDDPAADPVRPTIFAPLMI